MSANPITFAEIEAFDRLTYAGLGPWEVDLICRLDDAVLTVFAEKAAKKPGEVEIVPFEDGEAVKAFMTQLAIRQNALVAAQKKGG